MTTETATVKTPNKMMAGAFAALTLALAGCASGYGANTVNSSDVGYASTVREGTVTAVREVVVLREFIDKSRVGIHGEVAQISRHIVFSSADHG